MIGHDEVRLSAEVEGFYKENPFPDYDLDKYQTTSDLENRASWYFKMLDIYIPDSANIIEVGCGTGQLVNFLALKVQREVYGIDLCETSLHKARRLRDKFGIKNLSLEKKDIFRFCTENTELYDYVFCNGVIHHTYDPEKAFKNVCNLLKPGGFLIVGFYNTFGRIPLKLLKMKIKKLNAISLKKKKFYLSKQYDIREFDDIQVESWFADQFLHPHETTITVNRVMDWYEKQRIAYVNSFPPIELGRKIENLNFPRLQPNPFKKLDNKLWTYSALALYLTQFLWIFRKKNEGGYFSLLGRKSG